jgi:DNA topoisomerase-3
VTTYPRVDTTYLSDDIYPKIPATLAGIKDYFPQVAPLLALKVDGKKGAGSLPKSKKVFDNKKVTDHHAIIPTGVKPDNITADERKVYDLVALHFIAAFYPECEVSNTTVMAKAGEMDFRVTGREVLKPGWRTVFGADLKDSNDLGDANDSSDSSGETAKSLPAFTQGESGPHEPLLKEKTTTPPKYYTEATLLRAMETAGKFVEDETLRAAMKENGIGRPSSRASIIETLFKRRYIKRERKRLVATTTGIELIDLIREELLKSCELTGIWEKKLRDIEHQKYDPAQFIDELKQHITDIVKEVMADPTNRRITFTQ